MRRLYYDITDTTVFQLFITKLFRKEDITVFQSKGTEKTKQEYIYLNEGIWTQLQSANATNRNTLSVTGKLVYVYNNYRIITKSNLCISCKYWSDILLAFNVKLVIVKV